MSGINSYDKSKYWEKLIYHYTAIINKSGFENFRRDADFYFTGSNIAYKNESDLISATKSLWEDLDNQFDWCREIKESGIGNPISVEVNGRPVSWDLALSAYEYAILKHCIDFRFIDVINEVGAGYGRTANIILQFNQHIQYNIYDIEPILSLSKKYLSKRFCDREITFNSPNKLLKPCDLFLAIDCLHEMPRDTVHTYFNYADKNARSFYFSCCKEQMVPIDNICWGNEDYPIPKNWVKVWDEPHQIRLKYFEKLYFNDKLIGVSR